MIYVFDNPNNIQYNSHIYVFLRSWFTPDSIVADSWFKVAALRTDMANNKKHYTATNANMTISSLATVADDGTLIKMMRNTPNVKLPDDVFQLIVEEAINIPLYESNNQRSFPYTEMFTKLKIKERFERKFGPASSIMNPMVDNAVFNKIASAPQFKPKPCNCGKKK